MTLRTALVRDLTRKLNRKKGLSKGFTLIELIVVVVIIGVLAAVGIPVFDGVRDRAQAKAFVGEAVGLAKECAVLQIENERGSTTVIDPGNSSTVTCDGSANATVTSQTWDTSLSVTCANVTGTGTSASLLVETDGTITCTIS